MIKIDIPHVWDVDGKPRGVRHSILLDGDDVIVSDVCLDENGAEIDACPHRRTIPLTRVVHCLLNLTDEEISYAENRPFT